MSIRNGGGSELPMGFLDWQVALRRHTAEKRNGQPHAGVAPLLFVRRPGMAVGASAHSIICGLLPNASLLEQKTHEFRSIYEGGIAEGAQTVYDQGLEYLKKYYTSSADFDRESITTLLHRDMPLVTALRADPRCALLFYVFDLADQTEIGRLRCLQLDGRAEVLEKGPVFDNVWWHNTLFHGPADDHVVVHFRHERSWDTVFGGFEEATA